MIQFSVFKILVMESKIEVLYENLKAEEFKLSLHLTNSTSLKEVNLSKTEGEDVKNTETRSSERSLDHLNNKNNSVFNMKVENTCAGLREFPKKLCNLKYMTALNLSNNSLESLPKEFGNLCNLTVLILSCNRLSYLPDSLKHVHQLKYLDISSNKFSRVPDILYYSVRNLRVLDMSFNQVTTFNDSPGCLDKVTTLNMSKNLLQELPLWLFDGLCQLEVLNVSHNSLHLKTELLNFCTTGIFESLRLLNIENCKLTCESVQILFFFKNLSVLQMGNSKSDKRSENYMGNLRCDMLKNSRGVKYLSLKNSGIASLPSDLDQLKSVQLLDLSDNQLLWLPDCICNLINLKLINLTSNKLLFLPEDMGRLVNLREIHIANNKLCEIPVAIYTLTNLEYLDLYDNKIEKVESKIFKQNQLKGIDLGLNYLNFGDDEVRLLYCTKKESFRKHFCNLGIRSDLQRVKSDGEFEEKNSSSHSYISSYGSESLSDFEDPPVCSEEKTYQEEESWEEVEFRQSEKDELFDPNSVEKVELEVWKYNFPDNYCPAKYHLSSFRNTYNRNCEERNVEDGQFDSD